MNWVHFLPVALSSVAGDITKSWPRFPRRAARAFYGANVMTAQVTRQSKDSITIQVTLPLSGSMLQAD
jgi:hypothetical protein